MSRSERAILGPLVTKLTKASPQAWRELKRYIDQHDSSSIAVHEHAIATYLGKAKDLIAELPDAAKARLVDGPLTERGIAGFAFVLIEELVRRADVAARHSMVS